MYFTNAEVGPEQTFAYDAIYRLVEASGREHLTQGQPTSSEMTPGPQPEPNDPSALRGYTETYVHDEVGNLTQVVHAVTVGQGWTRNYQYATTGNRLQANSIVGNSANFSATYAYDDHGNMTAMPHLSAIDWDHADQMQHADLDGGGDVWFQYRWMSKKLPHEIVSGRDCGHRVGVYIHGLV